MPDRLFDTVRTKTYLDPKTYMEHAAYQSMNVVLDDWERTYVLLGRRIAKLRAARDERRRATESGAWPPPREPEQSDEWVASGDAAGQPGSSTS